MNKKTVIFLAVVSITQLIPAVTNAPCPVAKTGQTVRYRAGDDGDLEPGTVWPNPRFADLGDGTVKDNLTGLEWVKLPYSLSGNSGAMNWNAAVDFCNNLVYAGHSDWRLPSRRELMSLVDYGRSSPALPAGHPFTDLQNYSGRYWSSTSYAPYTDFAWYVDTTTGCVSGESKSNQGIWPVRGGQ